MPNAGAALAKPALPLFAKIIIGVAAVAVTVAGVFTVTKIVRGIQQRNSTEIIETETGIIQTEITQSDYELNTTDESTQETNNETESADAVEAYQLPPIEEFEFYSNSYVAQRIGTNPAYYYQHPTLPMAMDFRSNEELARTLFVEPTETGFRFRERYYMNANQSNTIMNQKVLSETDQYSTSIDLIQTPEELASYQSEDTQMMGAAAPVVFQVEDQNYVFKNKITDGVDLLMLIQQQDEAVPFVKYGEVTNQRTYDVQKYVVNSNSTPEGADRSQQVMNADEEFEKIKQMLSDSPFSFELQYGMPILNTINNSTLQPLERAEYFEYEPTGDEFFDTAMIPLTESDFMDYKFYRNPRYSQGVFDIDGDGKKEYIVRGYADADRYDINSYFWGNSNSGYTAIFKETKDGLILVNAFMNQQTTSRYLIYSEGKLYTLRAQLLTAGTLFEVSTYDYYWNQIFDDDNQIIEQDALEKNFILLDEFMNTLEDKETIIIDTKLNAEEKPSELATMEEVDFEDLLNTKDELNRLRELFEEDIATDILSENSTVEEFTKSENVGVRKVEQTGDPNSYLSGFVPEKDLGPDMYVEYAEVDLEGEGWPESIVHTVELSTSEGAPMTQTWEIFLSTEQGPDCYYIDYFGDYALLFNDKHVITLDWPGVTGDPVLVRRQPLKQELKWIEGFASDYADYEYRVGQAEEWKVKDLYNLTDAERQEFADRFLGEGEVIVVPANDNVENFNATQAQKFWATPLIYGSAEDYIKDPEFLLH